ASAELRCQEDGLWSLPEAYCQLTCRAPPPMANAVARTDRCKHDGQEVGSSCKYRCEPGHHVPLTSRKGFKVRCTDSGHWEEGGCVPVQCPPLPPVLHGSYTCTQRWQLGSRCWVNCSTASASKNHTVIRCSKNGRWSGELQLCPHEQGECTAPDPPFIITCDCPTGYGIGSVCKTSCLIPHSDSVLLPENVTVPEKITAPSAALVITVPASCDRKKECACRDPSAKENAQKRWMVTLTWRQRRPLLIAGAHGQSPAAALVNAVVFAYQRALRASCFEDP
ncbi:pappalysin-1-like, partial [Lethenteron reissneri]|uniref:pappalysin-1-like n=1 Tax=Lethenteron reissneri TaxID=7753 RepID=UPI002AB6C28A